MSHDDGVIAPEESQKAKPPFVRFRVVTWSIPKELYDEIDALATEISLARREKALPPFGVQDVAVGLLSDAVNALRTFQAKKAQSERLVLTPDELSRPR